MKFVLLSPFTPPLVGGLENVCLWLAKQLRAEGHAVSIVGRFATIRPGLRGRFRQREEPRSFNLDGISVSVLPPLVWGRAGGAAIYALMQSPATLPLACRLQAKGLGAAVAAHCQSADAVHYLGTGFDMLGFVAETAARQAGATFSVEPAIHIGRWGDRWIDAALYSRADAVLTYSECETEAIGRLGVSPDRLHRIHCRCELGAGGDPAAFRLKYAIRGPIVLFLGRKSEAKGVRRLLAAWAAIRRQVPDASMVIMGPSAGKCLISAEDGVLDIDDAADEDKQNALAACDLLCVPSDGESFGLVYYEAWNYGKPVVALDQPALRETIGSSRGGILVQPRPKQIAAAVARLLGDAAARDAMGRRGREFASQHLEHDTYREYVAAFSAARSSTSRQEGMSKAVTP